MFIKRRTIVSKKYKKDYTLSIRVNGEMVDRIDDLTQHFQLDRADLIRMLLSNALKYWETKFNTSSTPTPRSVDTKIGYTNQVSEHELADLAKQMEQFK
jgi:hypothetical protein